MTDFQDMMEIPYFREMVNTPSTHVYLWKNSVDVLHGGKHLTYGGVSANLVECPRCTDGYWWNHAQGMQQCSTDGCHTFIETNSISMKEAFKNISLPKRKFCKTEECWKITEVDGEPFMDAVDNVCPRCSNEISANLNIPPTLQENIGDKRVSEIDDSHIDDFNFDDEDDSDIDDWDWEDDS